LRNHAATISNLVGFFVVQERVSHALPDVLPKEALVAYFLEADEEVGLCASAACARVKVPSQLLAVHEGLDAACRALRGRGFAPAALEAAAAAAAGRAWQALGARRVLAGLTSAWRSTRSSGAVGLADIAPRVIHRILNPRLLS